ncbi:MAG: DUF5615 family PIN-like protein [Planctomycetes bacterium]|jgi:predicted nuclease of predicted toxin-antitoxin system|nr:DUF5615 family PIN-like protein [Planctomycetota bacterium]MCL4731385.1 DUF5615 family PIN-like protein [Planctomycetota bacterium]
MRLLADENLPEPLVKRLRAEGHDVVFMQEQVAGADDTGVAAQAETEVRILVSCDKDFGELVFARQVAVVGVVLLRLEGMAYDKRAERVLQALNGDITLEGQFTVVEPARIRQRPLPRSPGGG